MRWIGGIIMFETWEWSGNVPSQIAESRCWALSSNGGGRFRSGPALWGLALPTRKVLSSNFSYRWMTWAKMISGRHSGFLLDPGWSGLRKVPGLAVPLRMILMKWDTCRDPDEGQNLTTTMIYAEPTRWLFCLFIVGLGLKLRLEIARRTPRYFLLPRPNGKLGAKHYSSEKVVQ